MDRSTWPTWISTGEAAAIIGVRPNTLYRLIDRGEPTAYRFGRVIRLTETDVYAYIESARIRPGDLGITD